MSSVLPIVSMVTLPLAGAVQLYQMDAPPVLPAWFGSPDSFVARMFVPFVVPCEPLIVVAALELSFDGIVTVTYSRPLRALACP